MLRLIGKIRSELEEFIEQRERMLLVVRCRDDDCPIVLKLLDDLDQASEQDLYLLFAVPFALPDAYVDQLVEDFAKRHELANAALTEKNKPTLAPLPTTVSDPRRPAQERLRALLVFSRSLLPEGARRLVFALAPTHIVDRQAYLTLMTAITPQSKLEPWMPRVRVVIRDEPELSGVPHPLVSASPERSRLLDVDLTMEAIAEDMRGTTEDESQPMDARAQALLSLALVDVASARSELATERLMYLLSYYQSTQNLVMQGMVLNGMGDLFTRLNEPARAKGWYESALLPASESKNPILLSTLARNLGTTQFALGDYGEARAYFVQLDRISTHLLDAETKSAALYSRGLCDRQMGKPGEAIESFEAGAKLCRGTDQDKDLRRHLEQLHDLYSKQGMQGKALQIEEELKRADAQGRPS